MYPIPYLTLLQRAVVLFTTIESIAYNTFIQLYTIVLITCFTASMLLRSSIESIAYKRTPHYMPLC